MPHLTMADGVKLYYEETGRGTPDRLRARICGGLSHLGAAAAFLLPLASLHHLQPARLSAVQTFRKSRRCIRRTSPANDVLGVMDALKIDKAHVVWTFDGRTIPRCMLACSSRSAAFR